MNHSMSTNGIAALQQHIISQPLTDGNSQLFKPKSKLVIDCYVDADFRDLTETIIVRKIVLASNLVLDT